ncbi:MAG TPA: non-canonical purine NTP pyrophosphatase [Anaerolineae bacterium]|nr:non-canonical purine NTP pyrophosphatase [Anaerolineae bacterium]
MDFEKPLLLGTANPTKVALFQDFLADLPLTLLTLTDLGIALDVEESAPTPEANAVLKARAYFAAAHVPTFAVDAGLEIARFPADQQPGVYVRRIRGIEARASDAELLAHYRAALLQIGGESPACWVVGMALQVDAERLVSATYRLDGILTAQPCATLSPGAPLGSLMRDVATGRCFAEMLPHERPDAAWINAFIRQHYELV